MLSPDYAMKSSLAKVWSYVTGPIVDRDGTELPVSRLDIVLFTSVLAVALMVIVAQWLEPVNVYLQDRWSRSNRNWSSAPASEGTTAGSSEPHWRSYPYDHGQGCWVSGRKPAGSRDSVLSCWR